MIRTMRYFVAILVCTVLLGGYAFADTNVKELKIKSNPHCKDCKEKIETGLNKTSGVVSSDVDVASKVITVKYDADKTTEKSVRKAVTDLGFKADNMSAKAGKNCCTDGKTCNGKDKKECDKENKTK